jgi:hypothetical protein
VGVDGALGEISDGDDGEEVDGVEEGLTAAPDGDLTPATTEPSEVSDVSPIGETETVVDVEAEAEAVAQAVEIEGAPTEAAPVEEAPATRERRARRTRRRVTDTPEVEPTVADEPEQAGASPATVPDSADITPAPPPEETSVNGAPVVEETPEPVRRPRRVASASRGRSRRP